MGNLNTSQKIQHTDDIIKLNDHLFAFSDKNCGKISVNINMKSLRVFEFVYYTYLPVHLPKNNHNEIAYRDFGNTRDNISTATRAVEPFNYEIKNKNGILERVPVSIKGNKLNITETDYYKLNGTFYKKIVESKFTKVKYLETPEIVENDNNIIDKLVEYFACDNITIPAKICNDTTDRKKTRSSNIRSEDTIAKLLFAIAENLDNVELNLLPKINCLKNNNFAISYLITSVKLNKPNDNQKYINSQSTNQINCNNTHVPCASANIPVAYECAEISRNLHIPITSATRIFNNTHLEEMVNNTRFDDLDNDTLFEE